MNYKIKHDFRQLVTSKIQFINKQTLKDDLYIS